MGIKNLHKFMQKHAPYIYEHEIPLSKYRGKKIAIDINVYLFYYKKSLQDRWISGFLNFITIFKKYNIIPVFVYDTFAPQEKNQTKEERRDKKRKVYEKIDEINEALEKYKTTKEVNDILRNIMIKKGSKMNLLLSDDDDDDDYINIYVIQKELETLKKQIIGVTSIDIKESKDLLKILKIPYIDSENEAETLCSYLCYYKIVDAVLSNDTDVLAYGTPLFLTKLNLKRHTVTEINYNTLLNHLQLTHEQFRDLCIMCGTDYNKNIPRIGHEKAFKLIKEHTDINGISTIMDISILNYDRVCEIFQIPKLDKFENTYFKWDEEPDWEFLQEFLKFKYTSIESLRRLFQQENIRKI